MKNNISSYTSGNPYYSKNFLIHPSISKIIIFAIITIFFSLNQYFDNYFLIFGTSSAQADPLDRLSPTEKTRLREILLGVIQDPNYMTPKVHAQFWAILDKNWGAFS